MKKNNPNQESNQNFWELGSIQGASQSIVAILVGGQLAKHYGAGTALISIIIGNLILWVIGLGIISMTAGDRKNAIENVGAYFGRFSGILSAIILIIAFISWYMLEIKATTTVISLFFIDQYWLSIFDIRLGVALGLITSLLAIGGIRLIKWMCLISFPLLLLYIIYGIIMSESQVVFKGSWGFSFSGIITIVALTLPGVVNLPTFFRHSRSKADSCLGLTIMVLSFIFFQAFTIFLDMADLGDFLNKYPIHLGTLGYINTGMFLIVSLICLNLVNIYYASAGLEMLIPHYWDPKEYAIVGLLGTAVYTFFQVSSSMNFLETMASNFIACLGIVLLLAFLTRIIVKHRARVFEHFINSFCWLIGCITAFVAQTYGMQTPNTALITGVCGSLLAFLCAIFIEELIWSTNKILTKH